MKRIYALQAAWVLIGEVTEKNGTVVLNNASVIRYWGTTKGLGQIALEGPTKDTVLDPCGTVRFHQGAVLFSIDCAK